VKPTLARDPARGRGERPALCEVAGVGADGRPAAPQALDGCAIAFEDSPTGALAARAAGLFVVAVPSDRGLAVEADLVADTLSDPRLLAFLGLNRRPAAAAS
jgi:hypothetical protein